MIEKISYTYATPGNHQYLYMGSLLCRGILKVTLCII